MEIISSPLRPFAGWLNDAAFSAANGVFNTGVPSADGRVTISLDGVPAGTNLTLWHTHINLEGEVGSAAGAAVVLMFVTEEEAEDGEEEEKDNLNEGEGEEVDAEEENGPPLRSTVVDDEHQPPLLMQRAPCDSWKCSSTKNIAPYIGAIIGSVVLAAAIFGIVRYSRVQKGKGL